MKQSDNRRSITFGAPTTPAFPCLTGILLVEVQSTHLNFLRKPFSISTLFRCRFW